MTQFISTYGVWLVAAFIALETIGLPLPAEAALMAAAIFAAQTHGFDIWSLIAAGIAAAVAGNVAGFWIGQKFGQSLLVRYGSRVGLTHERLRIGEWLFARYGVSFVFAARFLPFVRNLAALLAGANGMPAHRFYAASSVAAVLWVVGYGLGFLRVRPGLCRPGLTRRHRARPRGGRDHRGGAAAGPALREGPAGKIGPAPHAAPASDMMQAVVAPAAGARTPLCRPRKMPI